MARIIGKLVPEDDFTHPAGPEPDFSESMSFNFAARGRALGGCLQLECHPHQKRADFTLTLYLPGGRVLAMFMKPQIAATRDDSEPLVAGGCRFEVLVPGRSLRTLYAGIAFELGGRPGGGDRQREVEVDLVHQAVGPMYGAACDGRGSQARYKQHVQVQGTLRVAGEHFRINGHGLRDHRWGARSIGDRPAHRWLRFGLDLAADPAAARP